MTTSPPGLPTDATDEEAAPPLRDFRAGAELTVMARAAFLIVAAADLWGGVLGARAWMATDPAALDLAVGVAGMVRTMVRIAATILLIVWSFRMYGNLPALGQDRRYRRSWAIWGWIVPIMSLWRPWQVLRDTGVGDSRPRTRRTVDLWWGLTLAAAAIGTVALVASAGEPTPVGPLDVANAIAAAAASVAAAAMIGQIDRSHDERYRELVARWWPRGIGSATTRRRSWWTGATAASLVIGLGAGLLVAPAWDLDPTGPSLTVERYDRFGIAFDHPGNQDLTESGIDTDLPTAREGLVVVVDDAVFANDGVAVYWVRTAIDWDLDARDITGWLSQVANRPGLETILAGRGTIDIDGVEGPYRLFESTAGRSTYAVAGAWLPACGRSVLLTVFDEVSTAAAYERLEELARSFDCALPPTGA